jgi:hypothetical protein
MNIVSCVADSALGSGRTRGTSEIEYAYSNGFTLLQTFFDMVFALFEPSRKGLKDGLASYRGGFGDEVWRSMPAQRSNFPIICPYLPPSGIPFGLASPLLMH